MTRRTVQWTGRMIGALLVLCACAPAMSRAMTPPQFPSLRPTQIARMDSVHTRAATPATAPKPTRPAPTSNTVAQHDSTQPTVIATGTVSHVMSDERAVSPAADHMEPALRVIGDPRSVQVISVSRPRPLDNERVVHFRVLSSGATPLLGQRDGELASPNDQVLFTVSVPAASRAGRLAVATVRFTPSSGESFDVPVELLVRAQRQITLMPLANLITVTQGGRTTVRVRIDNAGNATDSVRFRALLPALWRAHVAEGDRLVIAAGQSIDRTVEIEAPSTGSTGAVPLTWLAVGLTADTDTSRAERTRLESMLELVASSRGNAAGPAFGVSMSTITGPTAPTATVFGLQLSGPVGDGMQVDARWTQQTASGSPGLARVGAYASLPYFSLFSNSWRVNLGNAGVRLSEISGINTQGRGASLEVHELKWSVEAIGAQPQYGFGLTAQHGTLAAARVAGDLDGTVWTATASHLRDGRARAGVLDALSIGAARRFDNGTDARAEVAGRQYFGGHGLGVLGELAHHDASGEWRLRAVRAPGGADAFALAQTDVTATGTQRFGDMRLGSLAWYADDDGQGGRFQRSRGLSVLPQWRVGTHASIGGEVRVAQASGGDSLSRFGSTSSGVSAFASGQVGPLSLSSTSTITRNARDARLVTGDPLATRETQLLWTTQVVFPTRLGVIDAFSGLQRAFGENVFFAGQHELQVRLDNVTVPGMGSRVRAGAALGRVAALDGSSRYVTRRISLSAVLPLDAVIRIDTENNPLFSMGTKRGGWTTVLRIERSFGAPALLPGMRTGGVVFEDANGNGVRDPGERGIAGVIVRGAGEVAVTDRGGMYRFTNRQTGDVQLDERSLPFGLMLAPRQDAPTLGAQGHTMRDIAVEPVGIIDVELKLVNESYAAGTPPSLVPVTVMAVDRAGRRFLARNEVDGRAVFDALPPGEYRVEIDASGTTEPLTVRSDLPQFTVGAMRSALKFTVLLGPRRLRLFRGAPATTNLVHDLPVAPSDTGKTEKAGRPAPSATSRSPAKRSKTR